MNIAFSEVHNRPWCSVTPKDQASDGLVRRNHATPVAEDVPRRYLTGNALKGFDDRPDGGAFARWTIKNIYCRSGPRGAPLVASAR